MVRILDEVKLPETLYKYRDWTLKFHRETLTKQVAYFSSPANFNDPFDCKIPIRYDVEPEKQLEEIYYRALKAAHPDASDEEIRGFAKKRVQEGPVNPNTFKKNDKEYFDKLNQRMGVFSLAEHNNEILMWGHYANSHKGFCVGFDTKELLKAENVDFVGKVEYYSEFPVIIPNGSLEFQFQKQIFSKWDRWAYEDEYRLTKNHIENRKVRLPKAAFKEIILGYQMSPKDRVKIMKLAHTNFPEIIIYEAKPHVEKFLVEIRRLQ